MVMGQTYASSQKYPKSPFHTYEVKGLYQWYIFADDSYLKDNTYEACLYNNESTIELLQNLGFTIHPT